MIMLHLLAVFLGSVAYLSRTGGRLTGSKLVAETDIVLILSMSVAGHSALLQLVGLVGADPAQLSATPSCDREVSATG